MTPQQFELVKVALPMIIAVGGWIVSHQLAIRAQKKAFLNQITNQARLDIAKTLDDYQNWLAAMQGCVLVWVGLGIAKGASTRPSDALNKVTTLNNEDRGHRWMTTLAEYELLFPMIGPVYAELSLRHSEIGDAVYQYSASAGSYAAAVKLLSLVPPRCGEQANAIADFRMKLQNHALAEITGRTLSVESAIATRKAVERRPEPSTPVAP